MNSLENFNEVDDAAVAIIGMSGRFPKAQNLDAFWQNLRDAVESIAFFSDQELEDSGIDPTVLSNLNYVKAGGGMLEGIELFDAAFFGYSPRQAEIIDPQHRLFLECAWEALEAAGYNSETYKGRISLYGGASISSYFFFNLLSNPDLIKSVGVDQIRHSNRPDNLTTRVAYKLNLKGSAITVQTGCSTSLVAIHLACQSLLEHECNMALAGGVTIGSLEKTGYFYQKGGIASPDGHCRAFDAKAQGTVGGDGVGIVVLKRLEDAIADRDCIHAVIKGSAVNNDGSLKVGYTAPSVDGQAKVIAEALAMTRSKAETISYIEAHGTGTVLGDPIEIAALTEAFRATTDKKGFCAIGSVKTNIGHLDAAAGIAGLIKTVLALKHKQIPPSLHFEEPNPQIDFANSPFYVNATLREWKTNHIPRRAGVSSFGIGGTNAHVILEEAQVVESSDSSRPWQLLVFSAKTSSALETSTANLVNHFKQHPDLNLANVVYTLQVGRQAFDHRRIVVCQDLENAVKVLENLDTQQIFTHFTEPRNRQVVFMFPGQGTQYVNMGLELYQTEPIFREQVDCCSELLKSHQGIDLCNILYPSKEQEQEATEELKQTHITQLALFVVEYALAQLWMAWGIRPMAMIGHSIGEYVAACLCGVFSLEEALVLVATRGQLMQQLPTGAMLAVPLAEKEIKPLLGEELSLAATNGPTSCVVSGLTEAIDDLHNQLVEQGMDCSRLHTSHAFHSKMIDSILEPFREKISKVSLNLPRTPFISNVTGTWITTAEATDPNYWVRHLRQTVRFSEGIAELLQDSQRILLEVGPGQTLSTLAKKQKASEQVVLPSLRHPQNQQSDAAYLLNTLGKLWLNGVQVDWSEFYAHEQRHRITLPTYPFERKRYWVESPKANQNNSSPKQEISLSEPKDVVTNTSPSFAAKTLDIQTLNQKDERPVAGIAIEQLIAQHLQVMSKLVDLLPEGGSFKKTLPSVEAIQQDDAGTRGCGDAQRNVFQQGQTVGIFTNTSVSQTNQSTDFPLTSNKPEFERMSEQLLLTRLPADDPPKSPFLRGTLSGLVPPLNRESLSGLVPRDNPRGARGDRTLSDTSKTSSEQQPRNQRIESKPFVPSQQIEKESEAGLTPPQQEHLDALIARFVKRTQESKRLTQAYRSYHANSRAVTGFFPPIKEIIYPIHGQRGEGARLWDIDGNEYVDISMGFGSLLFGHSPSFVTEAIQEQIQQGILHGPQSRLAGQVAELICELTGAQRAAFCNDGTEAIMGAIRLARAATGRSKIALFAGSYHGSSDGVMVRGVTTDNGTLRSTPRTSGIPSYLAEDVIVLDYGTPKSLDIILAHAHELAAILVEPVQSSRPDWQPKEFLHELRALTEKTGIVLIFDEVITGFRMHPSGVQAMWGIQADITTYGKAIAAGIPIGVVAGKAAFIDAIDGGMWNYGDESYPQVKTTFFAGTFFKHPLVMAATWAALNHIKNSGPKLQDKLTEQTTQLAKTLGSYFEQKQVPIKVPHFGSLFRLNCQTQLSSLLFYHLIEKGVYVWEGRTFYLSTAHTDKDIEQVIWAVKESVVEMQSGGFLPPYPASINGRTQQDDAGTRGHPDAEQNVSQAPYPGWESQGSASPPESPDSVASNQRMSEQLLLTGLPTDEPPKSPLKRGTLSESVPPLNRETLSGSVPRKNPRGARGDQTLSDTSETSSQLGLEEIQQHENGKTREKTSPRPRVPLSPRHLEPQINEQISDSGNAYATPRKKVKQTIADVWQQLFGFDKVGIYDNFFELGGDSITAIQAISLLSKELNREISIESLYGAPTINSLANILCPEQDETPTDEKSSDRGKRRREKRNNR